jgi:cell division protein FtsI (penicillin-binding protein 3)
MRSVSAGATPESSARSPREAVRRGSSVRRLRLAALGVTLVSLVFAARLADLQAIDSESYATRAAAAGSVDVTLPADRGNILDRNGRPLAQSVEGVMVVADPRQTRRKAPRISRFLAAELGLDYFSTLSKLRDPDSRFEYIARQVPASLGSEVMAEAEQRDFDGLDTRRDPVREYPGADVAANVVGFLGTPDPVEGIQPLAGLELQFNQTLAGVDGRASYQVGARGVRIPLAESTEVAAVDGDDIRTTLDMDLDWFALRALRQAVEDADADSGVAIVLNSRTGEVLALADFPTYDANRPSDSAEADLGSRATSDIYEPGSVQKVLTAAALIDAGLVTPRTRIKVPAQLARQDRVIGDWFDHGRLSLTFAGVIAKSSNIGTVLAADRMSPRRLVGYLGRYGLGQPTGAAPTGESGGIVPRGDALTSQVKDRVTFGQSLSVNALQMAAAVNTIANRGRWISPSLIRGSATTDSGRIVGTDHPEHREVVSPEAARQTALMMERVLDPEDGVAPAAAVPGYRVAGKTGTAQRVGADGRGYDGSVTVSFAGFAPADDPALTVYVVLQNPRGEASGGATAGPVFSRIMSYALRHYSVPPTGTRPSRLPVEW